jgi:chromosome partitioning protein
MTRIIAVANQKGGVAKTTTVASIGAALAELGHKVLVVDLDPQACLTFSLGLDPEGIDMSLHDVLLERVSAGMVIRPTDDGMDLLPTWRAQRPIC